MDAQAIQRIARLYRVEADVRALTAGQRLHMRQDRSAALWEELHVRLQLERTRVPDGSAIAKAINYSLNHWAGLGRNLLTDALHCSWRRAIEIAAMAVVVDAKDEVAAASAAFYQHFDFTHLQRARAGCTCR